MTKILENPLFKYKRIFQQNSSRLQQEYNFLTKQIIKEAYTIPQELKDQYTFLGEQIENMPYRPEISEWIKCTYRLRRYSEDETESYCLNPLHPFASRYGIWLPVCFKRDCELDKICDDDPLIL